MIKKFLSSLLSVVLIASSMSSLFAVSAATSGTHSTLPSGVTPKLYVNFDNGSADNLVGSLSGGQIVGAPIFNEGIDGNKSVNLKNTFGKNASQYIKFTGLDMSANYTLSFWYKENSVRATKSITVPTGYEWTGFQNYTAQFGGAIISNKDTLLEENKGLSIVSLPAYSYATYNISDGNNAVTVSNRYKRENLQNVTDSRWHNVVVSVDRTGNNVYFYVDGTLTATQDVSSLSGSLTGGNVLTLGADSLGQYGIQDSEFDDFMFFDSALNQTNVSEIYNKANFLKLINDNRNTIFSVEVGDRFSAKNIEDFTQFINGKYDKYLKGSITDFAAENKEIENKRNEFLMGNKPNQIAIMVSDTHLKFDKNTNTYNTYTTDFLSALKGAESLPYAATTLLNAGDYDENRTDYGDGAYFDMVKKEFLDKVSGSKSVVALGNHQYTHPGNNGTVNDTVDESDFMENCSAYIDPTLEPNKSIVDSNNKLKKTYYYVFDGSAHYVVTNPFENSPRKLTINVTTAQLDWLESTMEYASKDGKPIFVVCHYAPAALPSRFINIISSYEKVFYISGHTHDGFGSLNMIKNPGYTQIELPSTTINSSHGYVSGGAYYAFIYNDSIVLRAYSIEDNAFLPDYDEVFSFYKDDYDSVEVKEQGTAHNITGITGATATSYGTTATVQNTNISQETFSEIIANNTTIPGRLLAGSVKYVKDAEGNYNYNIYDTSLTEMNARIQNGAMFTAAKKAGASNLSAINSAEELYVGTDYNGSADYKSGVSEGKITYGKDPIALIVYEFDGKVDIDSFLIANGGANSVGMSSRKYDIFVSNSMENLFEGYNKIFSYSQEKAKLNTTTTKWYYNWDKKEYTTDGTGLTNQDVNWSNVQYVQFPENTAPRGKYLAWVVYEGGSATLPRVDVSEFRVFTKKPYTCVVNLRDGNGKLLKTIDVPMGKSLNEVYSPKQLEAFEALIPTVANGEIGRTVAGEKRLWTVSYDQPITGNTTFKAIYSLDNSHTSHNWDNGVVTKKATCTEKGQITYTCKECPATKVEYTNVTNHTWNSGVVTKAATYDATGVKTYTCTQCKKATYSVTLSKLAKTSLKSAKITVKDQTYTGKTLKPSVTVKLGSKKLTKNVDYTVTYSNNKNIGKATVKITGIKKYSGSISKTFKINPKKVSSLKVKSSKKGKLTVSWKKDSKVSGYEIVYATNSKFTKGKRTVKVSSYKTYKKTISKLKSKKTYYVKVRAYKTVKKVKYSGSYTTYKKVKIK